MRSLIKTLRLAAAGFLCCIALGGCKKYLDEKPDQRLTTPQTFQDLQSLLDNFLKVNLQDSDDGDICADDYYVPYEVFNQLSLYNRNTYTWQSANLFPAGANNEWASSYNVIYYANLVLDRVDKITRSPGDEEKYGNVKGGALFLRSKMFLQNAWIWSLAYDAQSANTDLGIPLRLNPDFNETSTRPSVQQTYNQIIADLKSAIELLPVKFIHPVRASKPAACGFLARAYLSMRQYDSALHYADQCLSYYDTLIDYNTVDPSASTPFSSYNSETIYYSEGIEPPTIYSPDAKVDSVLYNGYDSNDLRKTLYYYQTGPDQYSFRGSYAGTSYLDVPFTGLATDEMFLTRAECYARTGNVSAAMNDVNTLLVKRWKTGTFVPYTATDPIDATNQIIKERRKELHARGLRWMDLKRYNKEGANITLTRVLNGQVFTLPPNDLRYALAIPEDVIKISGMQQNPR